MCLSDAIMYGARSVNHVYDPWSRMIIMSYIECHATKQRNISRISMYIRV